MEYDLPFDVTSGFFLFLVKYHVPITISKANSIKSDMLNKESTAASVGTSFSVSMVKLVSYAQNRGKQTKRKLGKGDFFQTHVFSFPIVPSENKTTVTLVKPDSILCMYYVYIRTRTLSTEIRS
jgi:hypothetical protein